jgi:hypothetical protein
VFKEKYKSNPVKKITCFALLLISIYAKAGSCTAIANGDWEASSTWSCGHAPTTGDNATIGAGFIVTVQTNNGNPIGNLNISGTLQFTNGAKINLAASSLVNIFTGGSITGGNGGAKIVFPSNSYSGSFSTTGPYYFANGGSGTGLLPVTLLSFTSSLQIQEVILYWKTANEDDINSFEIESSSSGSSDWETLKTISPMATDEGGYSYSFTDLTKMNGDRYYRLKITNREGKYVYSKTLFIGADQMVTFSVAPTVVNSSMNVNSPAPGLAQVSIYNSFGLLVKAVSNESEHFTVDVSSLHPGEYFLRASQGQKSYTTKFLKQ